MSNTASETKMNRQCAQHGDDNPIVALCFAQGCSFKNRQLCLICMTKEHREHNENFVPLKNIQNGFIEDYNSIYIEPDFFQMVKAFINIPSEQSISQLKQKIENIRQFLQENLKNMEELYIKQLQLLQKSRESIYQQYIDKYSKEYNVKALENALKNGKAEDSQVINDLINMHLLQVTGRQVIENDHIDSDRNIETQQFFQQEARYLEVFQNVDKINHFIDESTALIDRSFKKIEELIPNLLREFPESKLTDGEQTQNLESNRLQKFQFSANYHGEDPNQKIEFQSNSIFEISDSSKVSLLSPILVKARKYEFRVQVFSENDDKQLIVSLVPDSNQIEWPFDQVVAGIDIHRILLKKNMNHRTIKHIGESDLQNQQITFFVLINLQQSIFSIYDQHQKAQIDMEDINKSKSDSRTNLQKSPSPTTQNNTSEPDKKKKEISLDNLRLMISSYGQKSLEILLIQ